MNKKYIIFAIVVLTILITCFILHGKISRDKIYNEIEYQIDFLSDTLFTIAELDTFLQKHCDTILSKHIDSVNKEHIEYTLEKFPYLKNVEVWNRNQKLIIKAEQEKPIVRVYNKEGKSFFIAQSGKLLPMNKTYNGRILVANGHITNVYDTNCYIVRDTLLKHNHLRKKYMDLYGIWKMAYYIKNDEFLNAQISQIYINENHEIELAPIVGNHIILYGKVSISQREDEIMNMKFDNVKSLYINGFSKMGWNKYSTINLKYGNEIPCKKR